MTWEEKAINYEIAFEDIYNIFKARYAELLGESVSDFDTGRREAYFEIIDAFESRKDVLKDVLS